MTAQNRLKAILLAMLSILLLGGPAPDASAAPASSDECSSPPPGTVFCEDFEGPDPKAHFDDYDGNPDTENQIVTSTGPTGETSNRVVRFRAPAGERGGADLFKVLPAGYDTLYARWFFKYEPGFDFGAANHGSGLSAGDRNFTGRSGIRPTGSDYAGFFIEYQAGSALPYAYSYYRGMYQDCSDPQGSCWGDSLPCIYDTGQGYCTEPDHRPDIALPALEDGQWYCVEQMVDLGTPSATGAGADGELKIWLNGERLAEIGGLWIRTTPNLKIENLWLSLFHHDGSHSVAGELIDHVVVSTEPVGCLEQTGVLMQNAIRVLKTVSGLDTDCSDCVPEDIGGNGVIGIEEAIYLIKSAAEAQ